MIVVSNTYIPALKRPKGGSKNRQTIAKTEAGDVAYYVIPKICKVKSFSLDSDNDDDADLSDDDDDDEIDLPSLKRKKRTSFMETSLYKPETSLTGANWVPVFKDRMTMFIAGTPGAGKSYLARQMIDQMPKSFDILLFTALEENDGNFDSLGKDRLFKIKMIPEVLSNITLSAIRERTKAPQTILLFDDVDKIRDPKVQNLTFAIMNDALANGRGHEKHDGKGDIHVICTSHSANDYVKTKYTFENSNYVALFPGTTPPLQMYRMFDKLGLEKKICSKMIKLARQQTIRSIIIHKVVPMYMIFGPYIMLL